MSFWVEKVRILCTWLFVICLIALFAVTDAYWTRLPIIEESLMALGCFLVGMGMIGRAWCSVYIAGKKDAQLVSQGPYALCRNPLYLFSFLGALGVALASETMTIPALVFATFMVYYAFVIRAEEKRLRVLFVPEFDAYLKSVPRFFPTLQSWNLMLASEEMKCVIHPRRIRASFMDLIWFVGLIGIVELISACHETQLLPVYFYLY